MIHSDDSSTVFAGSGSVFGREETEKSMDGGSLVYSSNHSYDTVRQVFISE